MIEIEAAELIFDKRLQGSNMGSNHFRVEMPGYVDFYLSGKLHLDRMISKRIGLERIDEAFDDMERGAVELDAAAPGVGLDQAVLVVDLRLGIHVN